MHVLPRRSLLVASCPRRHRSPGDGGLVAVVSICNRVGGAVVTIDPSEVADRLTVVRDRVARAGGTDVTIVAVTKGFGPDAIAAAAAAGLADIGENYAQELLGKLPAVPAPERPFRVAVHFIGRLQSNKVRQLAPIVDCFQTVDRFSLVRELAARAPGRAIFVQVNVSDEPHKGGCPPSEAAELVDAARDAGLLVRGLMTVGRTGSPTEAAGGFTLLRSLTDHLGLAECSMGMTDDLEIAVAEGSTMVRVGSALFGARPGPGMPRN
jgi:PLP dependent protein